MIEHGQPLNLKELVTTLEGWQIISAACIQLLETACTKLENTIQNLVENKLFHLDNPDRPLNGIEKWIGANCFGCETTNEEVGYEAVQAWF